MYFVEFPEFRQLCKPFHLRLCVSVGVALGDFLIRVGVTVT